MAPSPRNRNREQSDRTRETLVRTARALFGEKGFAATSTEEIVARAGVTRGALYHHYRDKSGLFLDVFEHVERDLTARLAAGVAGLDDPLAMLRVAAAAFLDACHEPELRQIALIDAPAVVGWQKWREVDARYGLGLLRGVVQLAIDRGQVDPSHGDALAHLLLGAASEAALAVAHHPEDDAMRAQTGQTLTWVIERIFAPSQG